MDWKKDQPLRDGMREWPVVWHVTVDVSDLFEPSEADCIEAFRRLNGKRLQTWGRAHDAGGKTILYDDPHWIAVNKGTSLHTDPKFPRYTHQLKLRVDDHIYCRGVGDHAPVRLYRGMLYCLDTHSPHQIFMDRPKGYNGPGWNVSASLDSREPWLPSEVWPILKEWTQTAEFMPPAE